MNKTLISVSKVGSITLFLILLSNPVWADSTVGTNMSTTGTFTQTVGSSTAAQFQNAAGTTTTLWVNTSSNRVGVNAGGAIDTTFEVGGTASISGFTLFGGSASVSDRFELTSSTARLGVNAGTNTDTMLEVGGTASVSGALTLGGITTSNNTGSNSYSGSLEVSKGIRATALYAPTSGTLLIGSHTNKPAANSTTAFLFQNAAGTTVMAVDTTNTRVGINAGNNLDTTFEVGGTASVSTLIAVTNIVAGTNVASVSATYQAEFASGLATTSINFWNTSVTKGTCLKMKDSAGVNAYVRITGGGSPALVDNRLACM